MPSSVMPSWRSSLRTGSRRHNRRVAELVVLGDFADPVAGIRRLIHQLHHVLEFGASDGIFARIVGAGAKLGHRLSVLGDEQSLPLLHLGQNLGKVLIGVAGGDRLHPSTVAHQIRCFIGAPGSPLRLTVHE